MSSNLSQAEIERYSRHLLLPEFGMEGQLRLKSARILLIGAGGLGSPAALYLAAAGVGLLGIIDHDVVDISNLQRQIMHDSLGLQQPKTESAHKRIAALNPHVEVHLHQEMLNSKNALDILQDYDIILDGSDNFPTRYLVNDACVLLGKPNVHGSIFRFEGQASVFYPKLAGPCYRCLFPDPPPPGLVPSCAEGGVLGVLPGVIGSIQATEAIKLATGLGETLIGRLMLYDALSMRFREVKLRHNPECPVCGDTPSLTQLIDYDQFCGLAPNKEAIMIFEKTPKEVHTWLKSTEPPFLLDVREPHEWQIARLPGAMRIALGDLPMRLQEVPQNRPVVVYCRSGARSTYATNMLLQSGWQEVYNMAGGLLRWSDDVDSSVTKY